MDILKIFRMQEPVSKELFIKSSLESAKSKESLQEKHDTGDVISKDDQEDKIKKLEEKIEELKEKIAELKENNNELEGQLKLTDSEESEFKKIMRAYEKFITKMLIERQVLIEEKKTVQNHLANLEIGFSDLLEKYERTKSVVEGFKANEDQIKKHMYKYDDVVETLNTKYENLKLYSTARLNQANLELSKKDQGNVHEVAKLKSKILQSQAKISELEKHVKLEDISKTSMFTPLKSNIIQQK